MELSPGKLLRGRKTRLAAGRNTCQPPRSHAASVFEVSIRVKDVPLLAPESPQAKARGLANQRRGARNTHGAGIAGRAEGVSLVVETG